MTKKISEETKKQVIDLRRDTDLPCKVIAKELKISESSVRRILKAENINVSLPSITEDFEDDKDFLLTSEDQKEADLPDADMIHNSAFPHVSQVLPQISLPTQEEKLIINNKDSPDLIINNKIREKAVRNNFLKEIPGNSPDFQQTLKQIAAEES